MYLGISTGNKRCGQQCHNSVELVARIPGDQDVPIDGGADGPGNDVLDVWLPDGTVRGVRLLLRAGDQRQKSHGDPEETREKATESPGDTGDSRSSLIFVAKKIIIRKNQPTHHTRDS